MELEAILSLYVYVCVCVLYTCGKFAFLSIIMKSCSETVLLYSLDIPWVNEGKLWTNQRRKAPRRPKYDRKPEEIIVKAVKRAKFREVVHMNSVNTAERSNKTDWKDYIAIGDLDFTGDLSESSLSGIVQLEIKSLRLKDKMGREKLETEIRLIFQVWVVKEGSREAEEIAGLCGSFEKGRQSSVCIHNRGKPGEKRGDQ